MMFGSHKSHQADAQPRRPVQHSDLQKGDTVVAKVRIVNDGTVPGAAEQAVFAEVGTLGVMVNIGYFEDNPSQELFLISFQTARGEQGPLVTCLAHEFAPVSAARH